MLRRTLCLALVAILSLPAGGAEGSYARDSVMIVQNGTPVFSDAHVYVVRAEAGDVVTVVVSWSDPTTDLDLQMRAPEGPCPIFPNPQPECNVSGFHPQCPTGKGRIAFGPASERLSFVAARGGDHEIVLRTGLSAATSVPYRIEITVQGEGGVVTGPFGAIYVTNNPSCKAQLE